MNMTPQQFRFLREQMNLTREELAARLGDCTASTVNKWERDMHAIPQWAAEKMWRQLPIQFNADDLSELVELARETNQSFMDLLNQAARHLITQHRARKTSLSHLSSSTAVDAACANTAPSISRSPSASSPPVPARIVSLPAPPMLGTVVADGLGNPSPHLLNETTKPAPASARKEVSYQKKPRRKNGTDDHP